MKSFLLLTFILVLPLGSSAAIIDDFQDDTPGSGPTGWYNANGWNVAEFPASSGINVLSTTNRGGNLISGTSNNATVLAGDSAVLTFDFYMRSTTTADINLGLTSTADLSSIGESEPGFFGPVIRLVDGDVSLFQGNGSGGGSFTTATQGIALNTWYTISMTIDNASDTWTGTIVGGAYATETALTYSDGGEVSVFGFRTSDSLDLVNFALRANTGNGSSNGTLLDNIALNTIPEPQTYALVALTGLAVLALRRRRR